MLLFLGSLISWVPALLLVFVQAYLAGGPWLGDNLHIPLAAVVTSLSWIVTLSLVAFAVSAFVKWKAMARMAFFGILLLGSITGEIIEQVFTDGLGGYLVNIFAGQEVLMTALYQADSDLLGFVPHMDTEVAVLQFLAFSLVALVLLTRRIRAFQVVS